MHDFSHGWHQDFWIFTLFGETSTLGSNIRTPSEAKWAGLQRREFSFHCYFHVFLLSFWLPCSWTKTLQQTVRFNCSPKKGSAFQGLMYFEKNMSKLTKRLLKIHLRGDLKLKNGVLEEFILSSFLTVLWCCSLGAIHFSIYIYMPFNLSLLEEIRKKTGR